MARSYLRGHEVWADDQGRWFYSDTGTPTAGNERPCGHCGRGNTLAGHDGCLGELPGVNNACCGHGVEDEAYVQFPDGKRISGREAIEWIISTIS